MPKDKGKIAEAEFDNPMASFASDLGSSANGSDDGSKRSEEESASGDASTVEPVRSVNTI